jgi:hypothetical protein
MDLRDRKNNNGKEFDYEKQIENARREGIYIIYKI